MTAATPTKLATAPAVELNTNILLHTHHTYFEATAAKVVAILSFVIGSDKKKEQTL